LRNSKSAANVFGSRASAEQLWDAYLPALSIAYPADDRPYDASSADSALAQHLAFWTGKDCERMLRLMPLSRLRRDKWERDDYRERTILRAVGLCQQVYNSSPRLAVVEPPPPDAEPDRWRSGSQILTPTMQVDYFKGCVYVTDQHKILVPDGRLLKPDQFRAVYGGYQFALDASGKTTKSAWEAFTESRSYTFPKVHGTKR